MITPEAPFYIKPHEAQQEVWRKLEGHLMERLEYLRTQNDSDLSELQTAKIRGKIDEIKRILDLTTQKIQPPKDSLDYED